MKKEPYILIVVGVLAFAGMLIWRQASPQNARRPTTVDSPPTARITAYEDQIEKLSDFDAASILYHETATFPVPQLASLRAIAVDNQDRIYAGGEGAVLVLDTKGNVLRRIKTAGIVSSLAVAPNMQIYVGLINNIQTFPPEAEQGTPFGSFPTDTMITAIVALDNTIFVADANSRNVIRFAMNGNQEMVIDGTSPGSDSHGFVVPSPAFDITPNQPATLWIVNPGRQRLEEYDHDGAQIQTWKERSGMEIENFCGCCNPAHIARLSDGSIVTSEKGILRIKLYTSRGQFLGVVAAPTQFDGQDITLDLAVDSHNRILVADPARKQIRIFERTVRR